MELLQEMQQTPPPQEYALLGPTVAEELAVEYIGVQERKDEGPLMMFNDPVTGTSFVAHDRESAIVSLWNVQQRFKSNPRRQITGYEHDALAETVKDLQKALEHQTKAFEQHKKYGKHRKVPVTEYKEPGAL